MISLANPTDWQKDVEHSVEWQNLRDGQDKTVKLAE